MLINDASITGSLIVNASASLQNISLGGNIIPDETNLRNLGSTDKYFKEIYVSTGSINFVDGGNVVAILNKETLDALQNNTASANIRLNAIESVSASLQSFTASISTTNTFTSSATARLNALETSSASVDTLNTNQNSRLGSLETISASNISRITALETTSASVDTLNTTQNNRLSALETTSASVDTLNTTQNTRLTNLEIKTGSLATTGSNTFIGTQTITGSLFISANLVVQGTSSLENITASAVSIGTNIVNLNTANPAIRYAGLVIGDSGSVGGSGSFLYDSVQDEMIFVHRGANTTVTSSVTLMGPQTYDNIGNETYPTLNIIQKGTGNEHLSDSCIFDDGTRMCLYGNSLFISSSGYVGMGTSTPSAFLHISTNGVAGQNNPNIRLTDSSVGTNGGNVFISADRPGVGYNTLNLVAFCYILKGGASATNYLALDNNGVSCFGGRICAPSLTVCNTSATLAIQGGAVSGEAQLDLSGRNSGGTTRSATFKYDNTDIVRLGTSSNITMRFETNDTARLCIMNTGISVFACQVCSNSGFYASSVQSGITIDSTTNGDTIIASRGLSSALHGIVRTVGQNGVTCAMLISTRSTTDGNLPASVNALWGLTNHDMVIATNNTERMRIASGGNVSIGIPTSSAPLSIRCDASSAAAFIEIATCASNAYRYISLNSGVGLEFCIPGGTSQSPVIQVQGGEPSVGGGSLRFRTGAMGSVTDKMVIAQNGVACFASNVCAANFSSPGFLRIHNTMKTFLIQKNLDERLSDSNYFRVTSTSGGFQVIVNSFSQNVGVGWSQSQIFQAVSAPYWGGWIGSSTAVSTIGSGSGVISSAVIGNDGTITFRVSTGNNGTNTQGTISSYIEVNAFNIDGISITAL